jgi:outer membrane protein OmpA-like peptidoglycan-associated protein
VKLQAILGLACAFAFSPLIQAAESLRFITCPVYRDTNAGRKSGCWLADDPASDIRYDVSLAPTKPDWNHEVLVEGQVAARQDGACGGVTLEAVRVSILPGACTRHALPAEGFPGRAFVLPARNVRPLSEARKPPPQPWTQRRFSLVFDFDRTFAVYQLDDFLLDEAIAYIRATGAKRIVVTGYADTHPARVSGRDIAEDPVRARERAELAAESLRRLGVDMSQVSVAWRTEANDAEVPGADGLAAAARRRVDIDVTP